MLNKFSKVDIVDFKSLAAHWLWNKKFMLLNIVSSAVLCELWICRNALVFNRKNWISVKQAGHLIVGYLVDWAKPLKEILGGMQPCPGICYSGN